MHYRRTLENAIRDALPAFSLHDCKNYFTAAGYELEWSDSASALLHGFHNNYDVIVDAYGTAWNWLIVDSECIASIGNSSWACVSARLQLVVATAI